MRAVLVGAVLCLAMTGLGACSSDRTSVVLGDVTESTTPRDVSVSVAQQHGVIPDEEPTLAKNMGTGVPVALAVLERPTLDGAIFDPGSLTGKEILLWFWAPW